jgi:hypothetical protein
MIGRTVLMAALACAALIAVISTPANAAGMTSFSSSRFAPSMGRTARLLSQRAPEGDDQDDKHGDPDAYVASGDKKEVTTDRILSCTAARQQLLSLRGGNEAAPGETFQIVFVSAEIAPWSITGGLGAVSPLQNFPRLILVYTLWTKVCARNNFCCHPAEESIQLSLRCCMPCL